RAESRSARSSSVLGGRGVAIRWICEARDDKTRGMSASSAARDDEPKRASKISVVVPVYRSQQSLAELVSSLVDLPGAMQRPFEIVLVDDCSPDNSWRELVRLREQFGKVVRPARLLTNSGQHNAILCGFSLVTGDVVVTMDDDLQNPPDQVP